MKSYPITPIGKPRITHSTKFSDTAKRYYRWRDQARLLNIEVPNEGALLVFVVPMPRSWSEKKKRRMQWTLHESPPDLDNMIKALLDAAFADDRRVALFLGAKVWGYEGEIRIMPKAVRLARVLEVSGLLR